MKITIQSENETNEYEFDDNDITITDENERIFKKDDKWYITKMIGNCFTKWEELSKPTIIEDKNIKELTNFDLELETFNSRCFKYNFLQVKNKINEIIGKINEMEK